MEILLPEQARPTAAALFRLASGGSRGQRQKAHPAATDNDCVCWQTLVFALAWQGEVPVGSACWRRGAPGGVWELQILRVRADAKGPIADTILLEVLACARARGDRGLQLGHAPLAETEQSVPGNGAARASAGQLFHRDHPAAWSRLLRIDWQSDRLAFPETVNPGELLPQLIAVAGPGRAQGPGADAFASCCGHKECCAALAGRATK